MLIVAVASGTSADGLDVAAVDATWAPDSAVALDVRDTLSVSWPNGLRGRLLAVLPPATTTAGEWCALDNDVGRCVAAVVGDFIDERCAGAADLVVSPGQTVFHDVVDGTCRGTLQIGQPAWIAERTGVPVVSDLRARDVAAGGHGAPLAGLFDACWLGDDAIRRAALNLGGIANVTIVGAPGDPVLAFDTGPANCLLDVAADRVSGGRLPFDIDGTLADAGAVRGDLLDVLLAEPYFRLPPPKSTGRELFSATFLDRALDAVPIVGDTDLLATLAALSARSVADALRPHHVAEVVASGGGVRNPVLMRALATELGDTQLTISDEWGVPAESKEAVMWAILGFLTWHGVPATAVGEGGAAATGAGGPRILGRFSPGAGPLLLPPPAAIAATRLTVSC